MKNYNVISYKNTPTYLPLHGFVTCCLVMDKFNANGFAWGIFISAFVLIFAASIWRIKKQKKYVLQKKFFDNLEKFNYAFEEDDE